MSEQPIKAREVAAMLNRTLDWWYRNRARLEAMGFPPPIAGLGSRWHRGAVQAWIDRDMTRAAAPPAPTSGTDEDPDLDQRLAERAKAIAARGRGAAGTTA